MRPIAKKSEGRFPSRKLAFRFGTRTEESTISGGPAELVSRSAGAADVQCVFVRRSRDALTSPVSDVVALAEFDLPRMKLSPVAATPTPVRATNRLTMEITRAGDGRRWLDRRISSSFKRFGSGRISPCPRAFNCAQTRLVGKQRCEDSRTERESTSDEADSLSSHSRLARELRHLPLQLRQPRVQSTVLPLQRLVLAVEPLDRRQRDSTLVDRADVLVVQPEPEG